MAGATMVTKNHFCLFTQLALVIGTCIPVCVDCAAHVPKFGTCPLPEACSEISADFLGPPHPLCDATPERLRKASTTSTATTVDYINSSSKHHPFSVHEMAAATVVAKNHFCLSFHPGGHVELNPGPPKPDPKVQDNEVLLAIGHLTEHLDERQDNLLSSIEVVKKTKKFLIKVSDLTTRLANLEENLNALENVS
ncbi:hypothetical protein HPB51_025865 [Rhipicephalus microplus]|uniref:Secreted protein n=1 Tax=Rhipicephalus microplus TaxID=6941 RepID=A0A9J6FAC7_RHIMP|nr:hypothetical protein HPB51_025865 [Rhipicephalus microplus]